MPPRGKTTPKGKGKGVAKPRASTGSLAGKRKPRASDVQRECPSSLSHSASAQSEVVLTGQCAHSRRPGTARKETQIQAGYCCAAGDPEIPEQHRAVNAEAPIRKSGTSSPSQCENVAHNRTLGFANTWAGPRDCAHSQTTR